MFIVSLLFYLKPVAAAILRGPSNLAVVAGTNMTMTCDPSPTTNTVDWYYTPVRNNGIAPTVLRINQGYRLFKNFSEFSVDGKIPGQLLSLNFAELEHAGVYQCTATGQKATAELIVLASEPRCNFTSHVIKEVNRVNLFCSVSYSGYSAPAMEWSQIVDEHSDVQTILNKEYAIEYRENELTSSLMLVINLSTKSSRYSCKTYFKNISSGQASRTASNIPRYENLWTSPAIGLLYGPKNVTVFPVKYVFHPDDVLTCTSDSTPSLEFEWIETEIGNVVFKGANIVINVSMVRNEPYRFLCTGINKLTDASLNSSVFKFVVKNKSGDDESTVTAENSTVKANSKMALVFSMSTVVLIILMIILLFSLKKKKASRVIPSANIEVELETQRSRRDSQCGYISNFSSDGESEVISDNQTSGGKLFERVGADGTIYMEMSKEQPQQVSSNLRKPNYPPMFEKSVYASIDHSLAPLPLPTK